MKRVLLYILAAILVLGSISNVTAAVVLKTGTGKAEADDSDSDQTVKEPAQPKLSAESEARLQKFIDAVKEKRVKHLQKQMQEEIDKIAALVTLDDNGKKALQAPADKAISENQDAWGDKVGKLFRQQIAAQPDGGANMFGALMSQVSMLAQQDNVWGANYDITAPSESDTWKKGVHDALTPQQRELWDKELADRKAALDKQIDVLVKNMTDQLKDQSKQTLLAKCTSMEKALNLPPDRSAKLEELAKSVVEISGELIRKQYVDTLSKMSPQARKQITVQGNWYMGAEPDNLPDHQPEWKIGLAKILTADESAKLTHSKEDYKNRRVKAAGQIMIALLDEKLSLTDSERERLTPIAERLVQTIPDLFPSDNDNPGDGTDVFNSNVARSTIFASAAKATDAEIKPILDARQLEQWKKLGDQGNNPYQWGLQGGTDAVDADKDKAKKPEPPVDVEAAIGQYLAERAVKEREHSLSDYDVKLDDLSHAVSLSAEVIANLHVAAQGMAERHLTAWRWSNEQQVRAQVQDATPETIHDRLKAIGVGYYQDFNTMMWRGQRRKGDLPPKDIWEAAIDADLTPEQKDVWQKEVKSRADFRIKAITAYVTVQFEGRFHLSPDQSAKLEPAIGQMVHDYSSDLQRFYSDNNPVPWYLQGFWCFMPVAGIPEDQLKAVLTKEQFDGWSSSNERNNANNVWQSLQQMHQQQNGNE